MSKVKYGAKWPRCAPITKENATGLPTYGPVVAMGELISSNETVNFVTGELDSDDRLNLAVREFRNASVALNLDGTDDVAVEAIYGCNVTDGLVTYSANDEAPFIGYAFYARMRERTSKTVYFQCIFYPKCQAQMGNDNSTTKGGTITFSTANTTLTVYALDDGTWKQTEVVETEEAAQAWVAAQMSNA